MFEIWKHILFSYFNAENFIFATLPYKIVLQIWNSSEGNMYLFWVIIHEVGNIIEAKANAIQYKHHSIPFEYCIGNFGAVLFRILFFIFNLTESLQLEYNQAIVKHGNSNEYYANQYVCS